MNLKEGCSFACLPSVLGLESRAVVIHLRATEGHKIKTAGLWELAASYRSKEANPSYS